MEQQGSEYKRQEGEKKEAQTGTVSEKKIRTIVSVTSKPDLKGSQKRE